MPVLTDSSIFENHDLINLYKNEIEDCHNFICNYKQFRIYFKKDQKENLLIVKKQNKAIGLLVFFMEVVNERNVPAVDIIVIEKEYRRIGITSFLYSFLLDNYGMLMSGICLNKSKFKCDGSFGIWMKRVKLLGELKLFNIYSKDFSKFSYYKAFVSPIALKRRLVIEQRNFSEALDKLN